MNMQDHILAAMREQFERWEQLLSGMDEPQITAPRFDQGWSIKDVVAHLWAWQQVSLARLQAAGQGGQPHFPAWAARSRSGWEESADQTNARIYAAYHRKPWPEVYQEWRAGYLRLLELGQSFAERDLLDGGKYPWLRGYSLAFVLVASYEHHQEHLEKLTLDLGG